CWALLGNRYSFRRTRCLGSRERRAPPITPLLRSAGRQQEWTRCLCGVHATRRDTPRHAPRGRIRPSPDVRHTLTTARKKLYLPFCRTLYIERKSTVRHACRVENRKGFENLSGLTRSDVRFSPPRSGRRRRTLAEADQGGHIAGNANLR